jgi:hypothetical protein
MDSPGIARGDVAAGVDGVTVMLKAVPAVTPAGSLMKK